MFDPGWGLALISAAIVFICILCNGSTYASKSIVGPILATVITFVLAWIGNTLLIWWFRPVFGPPYPANGYGLLLTADAILIALVVVITGLIASDDTYQKMPNLGSWGSSLLAAIVLLTLLLLPVIGSTRNWQTPWQYDNMKGNFYGTTKYGAINATYYPTQYPPTKANDLVKVAESTAHLIADRSISQLGVQSYAQISKDPGYLEKDPSGNLWWIEALDVTDMTAFNNAGAMLSGFIMVNAKTGDKQVVSGHKIQYIPGLSFPADQNKDPDTYVYYTYMKGTDEFVHGLTENHNLEVMWDKNGNPQPRYTGIVLKHYLGSDINEPVGVMIFNPEDGTQVTVPMSYMDESKHPEYAWLSHAYPESDMDTAVTDFGQYGPIIKPLNIGHDDTINQGDKGRTKFDEASYVMTSQGLVREYTLTSTQADKSSLAILYVNPDTLASQIYPLKSATKDAVTNMMKQAVLGQLRQNVSIDNLQVQVLDGTTVWYGIATSTGQGAGYDGAHVGYVFVTTANSLNADNSTVVFAPTFDAAYSALTNQIANNGQTSTTTTRSVQSVTLTSTVDRVGLSPDSTGHNYWYVTVQDPKYKGVIFRVAVDNTGNAATASFLRHGDTITMTVQMVLNGGAFTDVKAIQIDKEVNP